MPAEGVVGALRNVHRMLVPGGALLDLQPVAPSPSLHAGGQILGRLDQSEVWERFGKTEPGVAAVVEAGLFALERTVEFDVVERFEDKATLVATIESRDDWGMSDELAARLRAADPPVDGRDRLRLRAFRAL